MREIRAKFNDSEYETIKERADQSGMTLKEFVHSCATRKHPEDEPLSVSKALCKEIAQYREVLNQIIQREILVGAGLYEDDVIRMELTMSAIENTVADFIKKQLREVKKGGNTDLYSD